MPKKGQTSIFPDGQLPTNWEESWEGMPEFSSGDLNPIRTIYIHFVDVADILVFARLLNQNITERTKYLYFPKQTEKRCSIEFEYISNTTPVKPPIVRRTMKKVVE